MKPTNLLKVVPNSFNLIHYQGRKILTCTIYLVSLTVNSKEKNNLQQFYFEHALHTKISGECSCLKHRG